MGLLIQKNKLVNQEMITGTSLSETQQKDLAFLDAKIQKTLADKARLELKVNNGTACENDQKKLIGIFRLLNGND